MSASRPKDLSRKECKDSVYFAQAKANEWCRITNHSPSFGLPGIGGSDYVWGAYNCKKASTEVLELIKECQSASLTK